MSNDFALLDQKLQCLQGTLGFWIVFKAVAAVMSDRLALAGSSLEKLDVWKGTELDRRKFVAATIQVAGLPFMWSVCSGAGTAKYKGHEYHCYTGRSTINSAKICRT